MWSPYLQDVVSIPPGCGPHTARMWSPYLQYVVPIPPVCGPHTSRMWSPYLQDVVPIPPGCGRHTSRMWSPHRRPFWTAAMPFASTLRTKMPVALPPSTSKPRSSQGRCFLSMTKRGSHVVSVPCMSSDILELRMRHRGAQTGGGYNAIFTLSDYHFN